MTDHKKFDSTEKTSYKPRKKLPTIGNGLPVPQTEALKSEIFTLNKQDTTEAISINSNSESELQISRCFRLEIDKNSGKSKINILNTADNESVREIEHIYFLDLVYKLHN